jgi:hypothetical protein
LISVAREIPNRARRVRFAAGLQARPMHLPDLQRHRNVNLGIGNSVADI